MAFRLPWRRAGQEKPESHRFRELLYRLRTEGDTPGRQAAAVGLGVFLGCTPFYGLHLLLCILLARLFGLNRLLTYLAAHVSLPGIWPLLVLAELQVGRRLRGAPLLSLRPAELRGLNPWHFGADLLLGSAVVGAVLALVFALLTFWIAKRRRRQPEIHALIEETARRYLDAGMFHWEFARGKLRYDPVYLHLLRDGVLPSEGRLLDLGCGRGLVPALLLTAQELLRQGSWPPGWPPPPALELRGIERNPKIAAAARQALGEGAVIDGGEGGDGGESGDLGASSSFPSSTVVLLLDVLHYLPAEAQESLLSRIAQALEPEGRLLIRDADAAGGWRFLATRVQERLCALGRRHWRQRFHYRSGTQWRDLLAARGFEVRSAPMAEGTPYSNILIEARLSTK